MTKFVSDVITSLPDFDETDTVIWIGLQNWQWHVGIITLVILLFNLFLFSHRLPKFGVYMLLVKKMTWKLTKYLVACFPLFMAFLLLFVIMLQNQVIL